MVAETFLLLLILKDKRKVKRLTCIKQRANMLLHMKLTDWYVDDVNWTSKFRFFGGGSKGKEKTSKHVSASIDFWKVNISVSVLTWA